VTSVSDPARPIALHPLKARLPHRPSTPVMLAFAFTAAWVILAVCRTVRGDDYTYDTAIFTEAVKGWATHGAPWDPIKGMNLLGDHWSPIIALLAPVWWVWPSPLMLVTAQAVLFGSSVGVVGDTAVRLLGRSRGACLTVAYGLAWGLAQAVAAGFHEIAFAVPVLAVVGRQLLLGRPERAAVWSLPLLLVKEDLGLTVAALGVLLAWQHGRRLLGSLLAVVGVGATLAEVFVLIPMFNPHHHYAYFTELPGGGWHLLAALVWPAIKVQTLGWVLGITGFMCLRSPLLLLAVPTLLWRFESSNPEYWNTYWHYSAPLMPIVFLAAVDGWQRLIMSPRPWARSYARQAPGVLVAAAVVAAFSLPQGLSDLLNSGTYPHGPHTAALLAANRVIPPGMTVAADPGQLSALAAKDTATFVWQGGRGIAFDPRPQYIAMDTQWWQVRNVTAWADQEHPGSSYRVVFQQDGVYVLKRVGD
jgi:uncharacterized membrane protein